MDPNCRCQQELFKHLGRVVAVGKDYRSTREYVGASGDVAIEV